MSVFSTIAGILLMTPPVRSIARRFLPAPGTVQDCVAVHCAQTACVDVVCKSGPIGRTACQILFQGQPCGSDVVPCAETGLCRWLCLGFAVVGVKTRVGHQVVGLISGGDPGYNETAKFIAESGLALALQRNELPGKVAAKLVFAVRSKVSGWCGGRHAIGWRISDASNCIGKRAVGSSAGRGHRVRGFGRCWRSRKALGQNVPGGPRSGNLCIGVCDRAVRLCVVACCPSQVLQMSISISGGMLSIFRRSVCKHAGGLRFAPSPPSDLVLLPFFAEISG